MNRLIDKLAIMLICFLGFCFSESFAEPVIGILVSASVSAAAQMFTGKKIAAVLIFVYSAVCGIFPAFFCAVPLMLYDALLEQKYWLVLPALAALFQLEKFAEMQLIISIIGIIISAIIYMRVSKLEETVKTFTSLRDEIAEKNIRLADRNMQLAEAANNEIHLASLRERNRIAREIHDNVGHMLTRSLLQSGALIILNKDEKLKEPLEELKNTLDSAMTGIRESVHDIHDDSIDLKKVIEESISSVDERFEVKFDYDAGKNIPGKIKLCTAGIVKEGLSNAVKHSNGNKISIVFREHPAFYQLMIEDNGICKNISGNGMGLKNMEERADSVGGRISFTPSENGFRIFMSAPKEL